MVKRFEAYITVWSVAMELVISKENLISIVY